jgi:hypothetical protein
MEAAQGFLTYSPATGVRSPTALYRRDGTPPWMNCRRSSGCAESGGFFQRGWLHGEG